MTDYIPLEIALQLIFHRSGVSLYHGTLPSNTKGRRGNQRGCIFRSSIVLFASGTVTVFHVKEPFCIVNNTYNIHDSFIIRTYSRNRIALLARGTTTARRENIPLVNP